MDALRPSQDSGQGNLSAVRLGETMTNEVKNNSAVAGRRPYSTPMVRDYGNLQAVTQGVAGGSLKDGTATTPGKKTAL